MDSVKGAGGAGQSMAAEELNGLREFRGQVIRRLRGCWVTGAAQSVMSGVDLVGVRRGDRAVIGRR
jgi:hypothetical protein